jgi:hypothetical protein
MKGVTMTARTKVSRVGNEVTVEVVDVSELGGLAVVYGNARFLDITKADGFTPIALQLLSIDSTCGTARDPMMPYLRQGEMDDIVLLAAQGALRDKYTHVEFERVIP